MADEGAERRFFGEIVRNANTYGSTTKPRPKYAKFAKHDISRLDTLQGIALKYGATNTHLIKDDWELLSSDEVRSRSNSELLNSNEDLGARGSDKTEPNVNVGESVNSAKSETAGMDFFSKYDSSIAALKSKVDKLEQNSSRDANLSELIPRRHSDYNKVSHTPPRKFSTGEPDSPVLVIRSNTRSSKLTEPLQMI
ncbi:hypothetical protein MAR_036229 [Mya arenaria]|uniref:Uncharacterized protein n=1 Tax=Mya arenaria TaxID=6604 RepID=A0ABY7ERG0_MYAAR|nr:hypothetical protein MAR_036229 [Mya arenaria]